MMPDDLTSERASGLLCPDYKLGAGMEAGRPVKAVAVVLGEKGGR